MELPQTEVSFCAGSTMLCSMMTYQHITAYKFGYIKYLLPAAETLSLGLEVPSSSLYATVPLGYHRGTAYFPAAMTVTED